MWHSLRLWSNKTMESVREPNSARSASKHWGLPSLPHSGESRQSQPPIHSSVSLVFALETSSESITGALHWMERSLAEGPWGEGCLPYKHFQIQNVMPQEAESTGELSLEIIHVKVLMWEVCIPNKSSLNSVSTLLWNCPKISRIKVYWMYVMCVCPDRNNTALHPTA